MKNPMNRLRDDLIRIQDLLIQGDFFSFSSEERQSLLANSRDLLNKLDSVAGSTLTVGLLGGTGVGKSTLMNALAGSEIASTSHRRPHTHEALIYRHKATPLPTALQTTSVPWHEFIHEAGPVQQVLLCDLPDFDSLVGENRQRVIEFLDYLDVLVWVASPEKYADAKFYHFLQSVPKAEQNFYFVLNKADLLLQADSPEAGYEQLARVTDRFQQHIAENGIPAPLIYTLSAHEATKSSSFPSWNQFPAFRHQIFQQRDVKEITAIKAANLDTEVRQLFSVFEQEVLKLRVLDQILGNFIAQIEKERPQWILSGRTVLDIWLERHMKDQIVSYLDTSSPLVGPARIVASVIRKIESLSGGRGGRAIEPDRIFLPPQEIATTLRLHLERVENRMANQLLSRGLPSPLIEQFNGVLDVETEWENLGERLRNFLEMRLMTSEHPSFPGFKAVQYITFLVIFLFFFLALVGDTAWRSLVESPQWSDLVQILFLAIINLFNPLGLAALGTYVLLNLFFGFRFYNRYKKHLQQRSRQFIESLKTEVGKIWEEELDRVIAHLTQRHDKLKTQMSIISALQEMRTGK